MKAWIIALKERIDLIGLVLAVIALVFAVEQFHDAKEQSNTLTKVATTAQQAAEAAKQAAEAASTRAIPTFPGSLADITEVVQNTCEDMDIMADVAGYGHYSATDQFVQYRLAIEKMAATPLAETRKDPDCSGLKASNGNGTDKVYFHVLFYAPDVLEKILNQQFPESSFLERSKSKIFKEYFHRHPPTPQNNTEFVQAIKRENLEYARDFDRLGLEVRFCTHQLPLYLWTHDQAEAAFVFNYRDPVTGNATEIPFRTVDSKLITVFKGMFDTEWKEGVSINKALSNKP